MLKKSIIKNKEEKMNTLKILVIALLGLLASGCVTGTRNIDLEQPSFMSKKTAAGTIYISEIKDSRNFEAEPRDPSTPSVDGDLMTTSKEKLATLIGRQRNGFGAAMGDVALPEGQNVQSKMKSLIAAGLKARGYTVSDSENADMKLNVSISDFWAWFSPGMWSVSFEAKLKSILNFETNGESKEVVVEGYGINKGQIASDANWQLAYSRAFMDYMVKFEEALTKAEL